MNLKSGGSIKVVGADGTGSCVFATLNVIDRDGDVTLPGAFGTQKAKLVGAHDWKEPNMGTAEIKEVGDEAIAEFRFNLDMEAGREWYSSMKDNFAHQVPQEFSYGFNVAESSFGEHGGQRVQFLKRLKVFEVSPVMIGAGVNTRLTDIKSGDGATLESEAEAVRAAVKKYFDRVRALADWREERGRKSLSTAARDRILLLTTDLKSMQDEAVEMLKTGQSVKDDAAMRLLELRLMSRRRF